MPKPLSSNFIELIKLLNSNQVVSGPVLGEALGISRAMIWKLINQAEQYNLPVRKLKNTGYSLESPLILLEKDAILAAIDSPKLRARLALELFGTIDSTNTYLKTGASASLEAIPLCLAETQQTGRGRLNRKWHSPFAENLYLSCRYPFVQDISELAGLSLAVGVSVFATLKNLGFDEKLQLKWPNDVYYDGEKLAGILLEVVAESNSEAQVIIGIGLNVNMLSPWTSLQAITGHYFDRNVLAGKLINQLLGDLDTFSREGFRAFRGTWQKADYLRNKPITITQARGKTQGTGAGISARGELQCRTNEGEMIAVIAGDATLA